MIKRTMTISVATNIAQSVQVHSQTKIVKIVWQEPFYIMTSKSIIRSLMAVVGNIALSQPTNFSLHLAQEFAKIALLIAFVMVLQ